MTSGMQTLTPDIVAHIFSFLSPHQVVKIANLCKLFYLAAFERPLLWIEINKLLPLQYRANETKTSKAFIENFEKHTNALLKEYSIYYKIAFELYSSTPTLSTGYFLRAINDDDNILQFMTHRIYTDHIDSLNDQLAFWLTHLKLANATLPSQLRHSLELFYYEIRSTKINWQNIIEHLHTMDNLLITLNEQILSCVLNLMLRKGDHIFDLSYFPITRISSNFVMLNQAGLAMIERLNLRNQKLIPIADLNRLINQAPNCTYVNLSKMRLTDYPAELLRLHQLQILDLSDNEISVIPEEIASLTRLRELYLQQNCIKLLPLKIASLALSQLQLESNPIQAFTADVIATLEGLNVTPSELVLSNYYFGKNLRDYCLLAASIHVIILFVNTMRTFSAIDLCSTLYSSSSLNCKMNEEGDNDINCIDEAVMKCRQDTSAAGAKFTQNIFILFGLLSLIPAILQILYITRLKRIRDIAGQSALNAELKGVPAKAYLSGYKSRTYRGYFRSFFCPEAYNHSEYYVGYQDGMNNMAFVAKKAQSSSELIITRHKRRVSEVTSEPAEEATSPKKPKLQ